MQLLIKSIGSNKVITVNNDMKVSELQELIKTMFVNYSIMLHYSSESTVSQCFAEMNPIYITPALRGGSNLTEETKLICQKALECKICRKCYARNALKAVRCRKPGCGHSANLRMKKTQLKK